MKHRYRFIIVSKRFLKQPHHKKSLDLILCELGLLCEGKGDSKWN
jgi:hypothetical protein